MTRLPCLDCNTSAKKCDAAGYGRKCCPDCRHQDAGALMAEQLALALNASKMARSEPSAHASTAWAATGQLHMRIAEFARDFELLAAPTLPIVPPAGDQ